MILLIIYIILFCIFLKINKEDKEKPNKKPNVESFYSLSDDIRNCRNCRCKYYDHDNSEHGQLKYTDAQMNIYRSCEIDEDECEEDEMLPGQREIEREIEEGETITNTLSAQYGKKECELCFPSPPGDATNGMEYNIICANPDRLRACNCGIKGSCSPCQEDEDRAHIYALQNMCTNRGYIWKYSSGARGRMRGYGWDCLHSRETCIKESLKVLKHPDDE